MPNRILRDWTTSDRMNATTHEEEAFFTRLLMAVDDFGRYTADPRLLLARLYPLRAGKTDAKRVLSIRDACAQHGLIDLYMVDGREFLQICRWQNVPRAKSSKYPMKTHDAQHMHSACIADAQRLRPKPEPKPEPEPLTETVLLRSRKSGKGFAYSDDFETAWQAWPSVRKGEKGAAFKRWEQCKGRPPLETILASIEAHKAHCQKWIDGFVPEMVNWISGRGFDTDPTPQAEPKRFDETGRELF